MKSRKGRKRRFVKREPNGRKQRLTTVQQIAAAERAKRLETIGLVLAQPHRKGDADQRCSSALGNLCMELGLSRECYDAGEAYGKLKRMWLAYMEAPMPDRLGGGGSVVVHPEDVEKWERRIAQMEAAIRGEVQQSGLRRVDKIAVYEEKEEQRRWMIVAARGLQALVKGMR